MAAPTIRLSSYKGPRPQNTYQSKLTENEIEDKLKMYKKIENITEISKIPLGTHIRYFSIVKENNKKIKKFRLGGFLDNKDNYDKYIILNNKSLAWSVDTQNSILYRKLKDDEIEKTQKKLQAQTEIADDELKKYKDKYNKLEKAYFELTDKYTRLKEKYEKTKTNTIR